MLRIEWPAQIFEIISPCKVIGNLSESCNSLPTIVLTRTSMHII